MVVFRNRARRLIELPELLLTSPHWPGVRKQIRSILVLDHLQRCPDVWRDGGLYRHADHSAFEIRDFSFGRIAKHIDERSVPPGVIEARCDQVPHAELAHVAERRRRAGRVLLLWGHLNPVARLAVGSGPMANIF
jgi:hypothetical protein